MRNAAVDSDSKCLLFLFFFFWDHFWCFFSYNCLTELERYYRLAGRYSPKAWWSVAAWPAWVPLICDMLRQWQCLSGLWLFSLWTLCMAKCYWIVYCHKSQTFQWIGATNHRTPTRPSIQLLWCVGPTCALRSVTSASGAGDFKRSTCLSISSALLSQPSPGSGEREKGNLVASLLWSSGLSLTLPVGQAWRTPLVLPLSSASSPYS